MAHLFLQNVLTLNKCGLSNLKNVSFFSSTRRYESFMFFTNHSPSAKITHDAKHSKEKINVSHNSCSY